MSCKKLLTYIVPFKFGRKHTCFYIHLCARCLQMPCACVSLRLRSAWIVRGRHAMRGCNYVAKVPRSKKNNSNAVIFVVRPQGLVESQRLS